MERVRSRQAATRDFLRALRERPCVDCGGSFAPYQMDFDHLVPADKSFRLSSGRAMLAPRPALARELAKCEVVCANCHRIRTWIRHDRQALGPENPESPYLDRKRAAWRNQARMLDEIKGVPCADCGGRYAACSMDFDHRVGEHKRQAVSRMIGRAGASTILAEVAKCDIVCANCHRERTYRRRVGSTGRE